MTSSAVPSASPARGRGVSWLEAIGFLVFILLMAWPFGTYTRPPFDDEVFTLGYISGENLRALFSLGLTGSEIHPFGSYAWFCLLADVGLPPRAMGAVSLLLTGFAFLLVLDLTLRALPVETMVARLSTLFLFATFPLLYGAGDALRWYPIFAFLIALFFWLDLGRDKPAIVAGLVLGLAASVNDLAIFAYFAFALRRYALHRRFDFRSDGLFHSAVLLAAWPGIVNFAVLMSHPGAHQVQQIFLDHVALLKGVAGLAETALGFFGGYRLGLFNGALALPYLVLFALSLAVLGCALWRDRRAPAQQSTIDLAMIAGSMTALCLLYSLLTSFDRGRALLFLAPFVIGCFALGYWRLKLVERWSALPLALAALILFGGAIGVGRLSGEPFKRNLAIPFDEVTQFVADNTGGDVLVASSETVTSYFLNRPERCIVSWDEMPACLDQGFAHFRYIVLVRNQNFDSMPELERIAAEASAHRRLVAVARFGRDRTARLKSRLTGTTLTSWILTVEIYR
jgi:hypothetical protein